MPEAEQPGVAVCVRQQRKRMWVFNLSTKLLYLSAMLSQRKWSAERISQSLQQLSFRVYMLVRFVNLIQTNYSLPGEGASVEELPL